MHAVVELATWLLAVDDIEAIGNSRSVVRDFEVKPLVVVGSVDVSIKEEVILILANLTIDSSVSTHVYRNIVSPV